jgi:selenocysteine lyase/cysteine desulfurase
VKLWGLRFTTAVRAPTISFTVAGADCGAVARALGSVGICVWDGNFYAPRPVDVLGVPGGSLVRVGFSMYNTREEAMRLVSTIKQLS